MSDSKNVARAANVLVVDRRGQRSGYFCISRTGIPARGDGCKPF